MSASRFAAAALAVLLLAAAAAAAGSFDAFAPLNGTAAGEVPPGGRAAGVGVLVSAGTTKGSLQVKAARGSLLAPRVALVHPDGTVLDQDSLVLAGAKVRTTSKSVTVSALPEFAATGLYKVVVTGAPGVDGRPTSGGFSVRLKGKPAAGFKVLASTIAPQQEKEDYLLRVPENGFLTLTLKPAKDTPFGPSLQILTASGSAVDHGPWSRTGTDDSITVKKMPMPFFGEYTLRIGSVASTGDYSLTAAVRTGKRVPVPDAPLADAGGNVVGEPGVPTTLDGTGTLGAASYRWVQVSGKPLGTSNDAVAAPTVTPPAGRAVYAWQLVASNSAGASLPSLAVFEVDRVPVAWAGPGASVPAGTLVTLDGTGSIDLDAGDVLSYEWTQAGGPAAALDDPHSPRPKFTAAAAGAYVFRLTVHDGTAFSLPDPVVIAAGGAAPFADAGRPVFVRPQDSVFLSGLLSRSAGGAAPGSFAWSADPDNPLAVTLAGTAEPVASFTAPKTAARLRFRLTVDGDAAAADEVQVVVTTAVPSNGSPVARAGAPAAVARGAGFVLDGSASTDDGTIAAFEWMQADGTDAGLDAAGAAASGTAPDADEVLRFLLAAWDGRKYGAPDATAVTVGTPAAPRADAGPDRSGNPGAAITLSGAGSVPAAGQSITAWQWTQVSGKDWYDVDARDPGFDPSSPTPQFTVPASVSSLTPNRPLVFALVVADGTGPSAPDLVTVTFTNLPKNAPPQVSASTTASVFRPGAAVTLTATATDGDGDSLSYQWTQVSGPTVTLAGGASAVATLTTPIATTTLVFRVTVSDGTGEPNGTATADVTLSVNQPPAILIASTPSSGPEGTSVTLGGSGTADPDDATLAFQWTELNPPNGVPVTLSGASTATATFTQPAYTGSIASRRRTFRLTVTDSMGAPFAVSATVNFVPNRGPAVSAVNAAGDRKIFYSNSLATSDRSESLTALPSSDADGDPLVFSWRIVSGPSTSSSLLSATSGATVSFAAPKPTATAPNSGGVYTLGVTPSDTVELGAEATVAVLVTSSWSSDIYPLVGNNCNASVCHGGSPGGGGLQLSGGASAARTNLLSGRVTPNDYASSSLYSRLNSGSMPKNGTPWTADMIALVRDWIEPEHNVSTKPGLSTGAENN